jgi:hypothetical protein
MFSQASKKFKLVEIDSTKNNYIIKTVDITTGRPAIILAEINDKNGEKIKVYKSGEILTLFVYKMTINIISCDSIPPLMIEGKSLEMESGKYDLYSVNELPSPAP